MSDLSSGPSVGDQLFVGVPLFAVVAELEVEAGHKGAEHTTTLD